MNNQTDKAHQELVIKDRNMLTLNAVREIKDFSETLLIVSTDMGTVYIEGDNMRIESLSKDNGVINVTGSIVGFYYKENKPAKSVFSRIFK